jgi:coenzyme Q-binding protein COQ10
MPCGLAEWMPPGAVALPLVVSRVRVAGPPPACYALIKDMESYPKFMDAVRSLRVLERHGNVTVTEWVASFQGRLLRWTEREEWDDAHFCQRYRQLAGDLKRFEGEWRCVPDGDGTEVVLTVDFDLGIPMLAPMLDPVARLVTKRNSDSMLAAIKARVESGTMAEAER